MDDTTRSIIERITVRYAAPQQLPSGHISSVYFDCQRLNPNDLARLAAQATGHLDVDKFDVAIGVAYNGIFFAAAVAGGRQVAIVRERGGITGPDLNGKDVVVVNDVVVSGKQLLAAEEQAHSLGARVVGYACIVDRSGGRVGSTDKPLWSAFQAEL